MPEGLALPPQQENEDVGDFGLMQARYKLLFDCARDMILFVGENGRILDANEAALRTYGYSKEEMLRLFVFDLRQGDNSDKIRAQMRQAFESTILFEAVHRLKSGLLIPVEVSSSGVEHRGQRILMSIIRDVSEKRQYLEKIRRLAYFDELTGLANRKSFKDAIREWTESLKAPFALMLIDIDHFKRINDLYSHFVGDQFLVEISRVMEQGLAGRGELFRLGGDEFTVLVGASSPSELLPILRDLRAACGTPMLLDGHRITGSVSVGISLYPEDGQDEALLLKRADAAMYRVKEMSRDGFAFYQG